jgi:ubiquinone/menaquinone biosynthesis C-methylase UbiE
MRRPPRISIRAAFDGLNGAARQGHVAARSLAALDSRSMVRNLFLSSAVRLGIIGHLGADHSAEELARLIGSHRPDRLEAWLQVGVDLGELRHRGARYRATGQRARALADRDEFLAAHYRSMLDYQIGPYADLHALLLDEGDGGRTDLDRYADDIAQVSLAAAPFVRTMVSRTVTELHPGHVLDVGCGSGVYTKVVLDSDPSVRVDGVDVADGVITTTQRDLIEAGYGSRVRLHVGDVRSWLPRSGAQFDLVMLLNNIYYFERGRRQAMYRELRASLTSRGELLVVSMTTPGSVAAAHLDFMLRCQAGHASLPTLADMESDLAAAGFGSVEVTKLVPTEPFFGLRARSRS